MRRYRILVVEDNEGDVALLEEAFQTAQLTCDLVTIPDGEQALNFMRRTKPEGVPFRFDIMFLDLNLPRVNGAQILDVMRKEQLLPGTPVIVFTSSNSPRDRDRVMAYAVERLIVKPAELDEFLQIGFVAKEVLEQRSQHR